MKSWSFSTYTIAAFALSGLAVATLIFNAATDNQWVGVLLPAAGVLLVVSGTLSVRARLLRYRSRDRL